jgi:transcriptional regulator with PAS, ATPase and Fis domain
LLRVLENGEFIKVGSSKVQKTNIRIVAATNMNMFDAIKNNKFREDLYYRLSTVEIKLPALRERKDDIHILFRKFSSDFALKYKMPSIKLDKDALELLINYNWNGNIRQLKNVAEQISVLERERNINKETLINYLPNSQNSNLPAIIKKDQDSSDFSNEREILYKVLFDMKNDLNDLKKLTMELMKNDNMSEFQKNNENLIQKIYDQDKEAENYPIIDVNDNQTKQIKDNNYQYVQELDSQETLSLHDKELELIKKSLERHEGKRKLAAKELGISERTLYRKIKQFDL